MKISVPTRTQLAIAAVVSTCCCTSPAVAQYDNGNENFADHPGRLLGIQACTGTAAHANCFPVPPDVCTMRDPVTKACLATEKNYNYQSTVLPPDPQRSRVTLYPYVRSCSAGDLTCVPDGIHTQQNIDWSQVEGAEFMVVQRRELEGSLNIFVDASKGSDQSGWGTQESPLRSLRAGLKRWLMPGKCFPYCGSSSLTRSGTLHMRPGVYSGPENREIHLMVISGVSVTVKVDADTQSGQRGVSMSRDADVDVRIEGGAFWLKATGTGTLSLLSMSVRNTSSDAVLVDASIHLITDLHFPHGRYGQVQRALDANGDQVTSPNWDISVDERFVGKDVECDGSAGCSIMRSTHAFDPRFHGPLAAAASACTTCSVPAPTPASGLDQNSQWPLGLSALISNAGFGCTSGGTLTAVTVSGVRGSGFGADFTVANGALTGITVTDHGSGYVTEEGVSIRILRGGQGCTNVSLAPYLVYDTNDFT